MRAAVAAVLLAGLAAVAGCTTSPAGSPKPATTGSTASHGPATPRATIAPAITVSGDHPVLPNGSQDTHAQTPGVSCDPATLATDQAVGARVATGFAAAGFPVASALLTHFLRGTGTGVDYPAGSAISRQASASAAFRTVNHQVQAEILSQLKAGRPQVRLTAGQLPTLAFTSGDLYWGFRGTQGLAVTGSVHREHGGYTGTLTYVIRDSYGFPADDTLAGFGPPMRYLQTACGAPPQPGGAHWFPDTIAVTVPLRAQAGN